MATEVDVCYLDSLVKAAVQIIPKSECIPKSDITNNFIAMVYGYYLTLLCADLQNAFKGEINESQANDIREMWMNALWGEEEPTTLPA